MRFPRIRYGWRQFLGDCSGAAIAALIALPYGLAMATLMGLPPVLGLVTSVVTAPITALFGRNPVLIGGTASATVPFIAAAVQQQGIGGAAKVSIVASVVMMGFCVLRLGRYIRNVPHPVVAGFSCGIGAMMLISQLDVIFGVSSPLTKSAGSSVLQFMRVMDVMGGMRWQPLLLGSIVVASAILVARFLPKLPAPLIAAVLGTISAWVFGLHEKEVGALPLTLPPFVGFSWRPSDIFSVLPAAVGLAFVSSVNLLITSRVVEHFRGRHKPMRPSDADAELGAYGIANVMAGMVGAPPSVGIPARSLANVRCGATTRVSNLLHAGFVLGFVRFGSEFISKVPIPVLAGITAWMGLCLLDWSAWRRLRRMRVVDASAFVVTAVAVLVMNAVGAVALGCLVYGAAWCLERSSLWFANSGAAKVAVTPEREA